MNNNDTAAPAEQSRIMNELRPAGHHYSCLLS